MPVVGFADIAPSVKSSDAFAVRTLEMNGRVRLRLTVVVRTIVVEYVEICDSITTFG